MTAACALPLCGTCVGQTGTLQLLPSEVAVCPPITGAVLRPKTRPGATYVVTACKSSISEAEFVIPTRKNLLHFHKHVCVFASHESLSSRCLVVVFSLSWGC